MATPAQFEKNMGRIGAGVAANADETMRRVAIAATQTVIVATPVLSGRARSNWLASLGSSRVETVEPLGDGAAATQPAIDAATTVIRSYDGDRDRDIRLGNSLPYIDPLNQGSSAQAPAGFVRLSVQAAVDAVDGARLLD